MTKWDRPFKIFNYDFNLTIYYQTVIILLLAIDLETPRNLLPWYIQWAAFAGAKKGLQKWLNSLFYTDTNVDFSLPWCLHTSQLTPLLVTDGLHGLIDPCIAVLCWSELGRKTPDATLIRWLSSAQIALFAWMELSSSAFCLLGLLHPENNGIH